MTFCWFPNIFVSLSLFRSAHVYLFLRVVSVTPNGKICVLAFHIQILSAYIWLHCCPRIRGKQKLFSLCQHRLDMGEYEKWKMTLVKHSWDSFFCPSINIQIWFWQNNDITSWLLPHDSYMDSILFLCCLVVCIYATEARLSQNPLKHTVIVISYRNTFLEASIITCLLQG